MPEPVVHHDDVGERLVAAAAGEPAAFEDLYRLTSARLYGVCLRIVVRHGDAEDVLQQVYTSIWRDAPTAKVFGTDGLRWLVMLARNRAIDRLHAGGYSRYSGALDFLAATSETMMHPPSPMEGVHSLDDCMRELEPSNLDLLRTAFFEALTYQELAARSETPLGTVKNRLQHALAKLDACLVVGKAPSYINLPERQDRYLQAGEYVVGLLDAASRQWMDKRIATDSALADAVDAWEERLFPLALQVPGHPVPAYVWARISSELGLGAGAVSTWPSPAAVAADEKRLRRQLALWRGLAAGALLTAMACSAGLLLRRDGGPAAPSPMAQMVLIDTTPMVATLAQNDGKPCFAATLDAHSGRMTIMPLQPPATDGRVMELWLVPVKGKPHSLGVMDTHHAQVSSIPPIMLPMLNKGAELKVTLEPPGGAPAGEITGPVLAKGDIIVL